MYQVVVFFPILPLFESSFNFSLVPHRFFSSIWYQQRLYPSHTKTSNTSKLVLPPPHSSFSFFWYQKQLYISHNKTSKHKQTCFCNKLWSLHNCFWKALAAKTIRWKEIDVVKDIFIWIRRGKGTWTSSSIETSNNWIREHNKNL